PILYLVLSQIKAFTLIEVEDWAKKSLSPLTTVVSDGMHCFNAVKKAGCSHQKEVVGNKRKSTSMECFTWVNTILGNVKNAISGTYHSFDFARYGHRYLGEYQYRFNLAEMFTRLCSATAKAGKRPEKWLRLALADD